MRARFSLTQKVGFTFGRQLVAVAFAMMIALAAQTVLAVEVNGFDVEEISYERWRITGHVEVDEEAGETATIDFGDELDGESTSTDFDGTFEYDFSAPYGGLISFVAIIGSDQSDAEEHTLFDPNGE